jgi:hypothetical protein
MAQFGGFDHPLVGTLTVAARLQVFRENLEPYAAGRQEFARQPVLRF